MTQHNATTAYSDCLVSRYKDSKRTTGLKRMFRIGTLKNKLLKVGSGEQCKE